MGPGQQFEEDQAQGVDVGAFGDGIRGRRAARVEGVEMLGGHVRERAAEHRPADLPLGRGRLAHGREVEIQQHGRAVGGEQDVGGLQVAVEQAPRMRVVEAFGQSGDDPDGRPHGRRLAEELAGGLVGIVAGCGRMRLRRRHRCVADDPAQQ